MCTPFFPKLIPDLPFHAPLLPFYYLFPDFLRYRFFKGEFSFFIIYTLKPAIFW